MLEYQTPSIRNLRLHYIYDIILLGLCTAFWTLFEYGLRPAFYISFLKAARTNNFGMAENKNKKMTGK